MTKEEKQIFGNLSESLAKILIENEQLKKDIKKLETKTRIQTEFVNQILGRANYMKIGENHSSHSILATIEIPVDFKSSSLYPESTTLLSLITDKLMEQHKRIKRFKNG